MMKFGRMILLAGLWRLEVFLRNVWIHPYCSEAATPCRGEDVFFFDQTGLGIQNGAADHFSYVSQNLSGSLAILVPFLLFKKNRALFEDLRWIGECMLWNGVVTEGFKLIVQRPRPFVYTDPTHLGAISSHYISFYSGHTSFSAASLSALLLVLWKRKVDTRFWMSIFLISQVLVQMTGLFRVLAGRHFPSDVLTGATMGVLVSSVLYWIQKKPKVNLKRAHRKEG